MHSSNLLKGSGVKRKKETGGSLSRKKAKTQHLTINDLPWKSVSRPSDTGLGGDDGILELEEVEGVEVVYEDTGVGRVVKFNVIAETNANSTGELDKSVDTHDEERNDDDMRPAASNFTFDSAKLLPEWHIFSLHPKIMMALHDKGFFTPTPIQSTTLPVALMGRDVIGVAQTGSGKTLAYGLPILNGLLSQPRPSSSHRRPLNALILAPTRELALQVSSHLNAIITSFEYKITDAAKSAETSDARNKMKPPPHVSIAAIVGGMSLQKQRRLLDRGLDILVATPGRLWDILQDDDRLAQEIRRMRFLVLDEADRMIEAGHFAELDNILRLTLRGSQDERIDEEGSEDVVDEIGVGTVPKKAAEGSMQTFVFSATLSKDLQRNFKKRLRIKSNKRHYKHEKPASTLDDLLLRLDFRDPTPEVIDLSPVGGVAPTLQEGKIECLSKDKDVYLYYFLLRHPGKSLVFLSSIDGIRRLMPLIELLHIKSFNLHSQLEQRQRLKNLDRFKNTPNSVLLATDVAARGLDIPSVDHVIHFQIPRTAETYIHRTGRTARAMRKGFSMLMVAPDERRVVSALLRSLCRDEEDISVMSVELSMLDKLKARVQLARRIELAQHKTKKVKHDRKWVKETAEVLGVELDSDFVNESESENSSHLKRKGRDRQLEAMKAELRQMLSEPLIVHGVSAKYITSGSRPIVDDLLAGELNENMLGLKKAEAGVELVKSKRKTKSKMLEKK